MELLGFAQRVHENVISLLERGIEVRPWSPAGIAAGFTVRLASPEKDKPTEDTAGDDTTKTVGRSW